MVIRIDPRVPLVWRAPHTLQLGVDHPIVLSELTPALETVVAALRCGIPPAAAELLGVDAGASPGEIGALLTALGPSLIDTQSERVPPHTQASVCIDGEGPTAQRLRSLLGEIGIPAVSRLGSADALDHVALAVIVGHYALLPVRHAFWLRRDVPHLPVVYSDTHVRIGPLVTPGHGPCLYCLELAHTDADAAWPSIASQLQDKTAPTETPLLSIDTAGRSAGLVQHFLAGESTALLAHSLAIDERSGALRLRAHHSHGSCGCQALPENGTAPEVRAAAVPSRPSSTPAGCAPA